MASKIIKKNKIYSQEIKLISDELGIHPDSEFSNTDLLSLLIKPQVFSLMRFLNPQLIIYLGGTISSLLSIYLDTIDENISLPHDRYNYMKIREHYIFEYLLFINKYREELGAAAYFRLHTLTFNLHYDSMTTIRLIDTLIQQICNTNITQYAAQCDEHYCDIYAYLSQLFDNRVVKFFLNSKIISICIEKKHLKSLKEVVSFAKSLPIFNDSCDRIFFNEKINLIVSSNNLSLLEVIKCVSRIAYEIFNNKDMNKTISVYNNNSLFVSMKDKDEDSNKYLEAMSLIILSDQEIIQSLQAYQLDNQKINNIIEKLYEKHKEQIYNHSDLKT